MFVAINCTRSWGAIGPKGGQAHRSGVAQASLFGVVNPRREQLERRLWVDRGRVQLAVVLLTEVVHALMSESAGLEPLFIQR